MKVRWDKLWYIATTLFFGFWAIIFVGVFITSLGKNAVDMCVRIGFEWRHTGNYVGLITGFLAYVVFAATLWALRLRHNLDWIMKFTHELTHTLAALLFFGKIKEFVIKDRECYVSYLTGPIGYVPITLSPYCIPIYTFMLFPFRFAGDSHYMIVFDALIAFTYAFHLHSFILQTRFKQHDIENCGKALSVAFISFVHMAVISLILATPKGGVMKALHRVFWEYPINILSSPVEWFHDVVKYF